MNDSSQDKAQLHDAGSVAFSSGPYRGEINRLYQYDQLIAALAELPERLAANEAVLVAGGRNQNIRITLPGQDRPLSVLVKRFGSQSVIKDWIDLRFRETKAQRSYRAAMHLQASGVGTPDPVAFLQLRTGNKLVESYFITAYQPELEEFGDILLQQLHHDARCSKLMPILQQVAELCRRMHDAGYQHNDLGNQNILLANNARSGSGASFVIDLNRGRIHQQLSLQQRGEDLARLNIPSNLKLMFLDMYWGGPTPQPLLRAHRLHRFYFSLRVMSRRLRHPFREARIAKASQSLPADQKMPSPRDFWIWDDCSDQPLAALDRQERSRSYPAGRGLRMFRDAVFSAPGIWLSQKRSRALAFTREVSLRDRVGVSLSPESATLNAELQLLAELGTLPVLVRVNHQDDETRLALQYELIDRLHASGHSIKLALLQDRNAIKDTSAWKEFVLAVLERTANKLASLEYGHAINRVKWGIWSFAELRQFYSLLPEIRQRYPDLAITGPATIDFEYPFLLTALKLWPASVQRAAVSHHLYVDRRGAPENLQSGFNALGKFTLAKAIANRHGTESVEVTEVNWPIQGTGIHSPVTPPFEYPHSARDAIFDSGVDESDAADFMIRYLVLAICSGLVDRVYWWRLVARGYGLVDLQADGTLRQRPGFTALRHFMHTLGSARLVRTEVPGPDRQHAGVYRFWFRTPEKEQIVLCWAHGDAIEFPADMQHSHVQDREGDTLSALPVELTGSPVYLRQVSAGG